MRLPCTLQRSDLWPKIMSALEHNFCSCCNNLVKVAIETLSELPRLAQKAFTQLTPAGKIQAAGLLLPLMENESIELAFLCYQIDSFKVEKSAKKLSKKLRDPNLIAEHANNLRILAVQSHRIGDDSIAVKTAKQSLDYFNQLAKHDLIRFELVYARSMSNYAALLGHDGKNNEAIGYAKQALDIFQILATKNPDRFEPDYALSLNNYANRLGDVGRDDDAIVNTKQALDIRQRLAAKNPDRFEPDYAMSLSNYANRLRDIGNDEGIDYAKQALDISQRLVANNPDRFEPDYVMFLSNFAGHLVDAGKDDDAIDYTKQSLEIYKRLTAKNPDRFEPDYARSLSNYANQLSDVGKDEEAIVYAKHALDIFKRLFAKNPERFGKDYYINHYFLQLLHWLFDLKLLSNDGLEDLTKIISGFVDYKKVPAEFYSNFVQACMEQEHNIQLEKFKQTLLLSRGLSKADRHYRQDALLCLYCWMNRYEPSALAGIDWQDDWQKFIQRRKNRLPHWMQRLSQRLKFDFVIA